MMEKKTFDVSVYTKDDRLFEFEMTLKEMLELLRNLRDYSFIRLGNEYVNKMTINTIMFETPEILNDLRNYMNKGELGGLTRSDIQKKYIGGNNVSGDSLN